MHLSPAFGGTFIRDHRGQSIELNSLPYVQEILEREVSRPTREELLARIRLRPSVELGTARGRRMSDYMAAGWGFETPK